MIDPTWTMKLLVDLCKRSDGIRCGPFGTQLNRDEFRKAGVPLWGIKHVNAKFQYATDEFVEETTAERLAQYDLIPGDLVMTRKGTVGNCAAYPEAFPPGIMHSDLLRLRLDPDEADPSFFVHQLHHSSDVQRQLASISGGAVMPGINVGRLKKIMVRVPPLAEQKRITRILDAADALRAKRREALVQLDTLLQSTFLDMFGDPVTNPMGWDERTLGELAQDSFRNGLSPSTKGTVDGEVLTLSAITRGRFDFAAKKGASFDKQPSPSQRLSTDTFLICRGNGNRRLVGTGSYPDRSSNRVCFPDTMIGVTIEPSVLAAAYLQNVWRSRRIRSQIERGARTTNGTHKVNQKLLSSIVFPVPPANLQRRFTAVVDSIERQKANQRVHLAELDTLFASLQSRAFRGDL